MSRVRGISCFRCLNKIDRYDDTILCQKCENSFHIKCVNISIEVFNEMRENGSGGSWICEKCSLPSNSSSSLTDDREEIGKAKNPIENAVLEALERIVSPLYSEIVELKSLIISQNKQINDLIEEIHILKEYKNNYLVNETSEGNTVNDSNEHRTDYSIDRVSPVIPPTVRETSDVPESTDDSRKDSIDRVSPMIQPTERVTSYVPVSAGPMPVVHVDGGLESTQASSGAGDWKIVNYGRKSNSKIKSKERTAAKTELKDRTSKKLNKPIIGSLNSSALVGVPKRRLSHIHVSRLSPSTTVEDLIKFFNNGIPDLSCEKLNSKQPEIYASFKLSFPAEFLTQIMAPSFWPEGIMVNKFFRRSNQTAVKIDEKQR